MQCNYRRESNEAFPVRNQFSQVANCIEIQCSQIELDSSESLSPKALAGAKLQADTLLSYWSCGKKIIRYCSINWLMRAIHVQGQSRGIGWCKRSMLKHFALNLQQLYGMAQIRSRCTCTLSTLCLWQEAVKVISTHSKKLDGCFFQTENWLKHYYNKICYNLSLIWSM